MLSLINKPSDLGFLYIGTSKQIKGLGNEFGHLGWSIQAHAFIHTYLANI